MEVVDFGVGDRVCVSGDQSKIGKVKYLGYPEFSTGCWVGIELFEPKGRNDGSVHGRRYFTCKPNYGLFVRASFCSRVDNIDMKRDEKDLRPRSAGKSSQVPMSTSSRLRMPSSRPSASDSNASHVLQKIQSVLKGPQTQIVESEAKLISSPFLKTPVEYSSYPAPGAVTASTSASSTSSTSSSNSSSLGVNSPSLSRTGSNRSRTTGSPSLITRNTSAAMLPPPPPSPSMSSSILNSPSLKQQPLFANVDDLNASYIDHLVSKLLSSPGFINEMEKRELQFKQYCNENTTSLQSDLDSLTRNVNVRFSSLDSFLQTFMPKLDEIISHSEESQESLEKLNTIAQERALTMDEKDTIIDKQRRELDYLKNALVSVSKLARDAQQGRNDVKRNLESQTAMLDSSGSALSATSSLNL